MRRLNEWAARAAGDHESRGPALALGRSVLALAQLSVVLFTPMSALFVPTAATATGVRCEGVRAVSPWCVGGPGPGLAVTIAVLSVAASGYRPRWTCVPHWYVTAGMAMSMPLAHGGDRVAQVATMLLVPICLGDPRRWQWSRVVAPLPPWWRGSAFAAHWALRVQVVAVYAAAVAAKLGDAEWRGGTALRLVAVDPVSGFPAPVVELLDPLLDSAAVVPLTWSVMAVQVVIAVGVLIGGRTGRVALVAGVALHVAIGTLMRLPSFGLVMVAVLVVTGPHMRRRVPGGAVVPERRT